MAQAVTLPHCASGASQDSVVVVEPGTGRIAECLFSVPDITAVASDSGSSRIAFVSDGRLGVWDGSSGSGPTPAEASHPLASGLSAVARTSAEVSRHPPGRVPRGARAHHAPRCGFPGDAVGAGAFADSYRFHVTTMTIRPNGTGTATWRSHSGGSQDYRSAVFHLTSLNGRSAAGVVDSSSEPAAWAPGQRFSLMLGHNDMLVVTPSGPLAPMCGSVAEQNDIPGHAPTGVNCGA